jgi:diguanylate cyclase (GGDEF)-like protein/putative nucleotidyltransferase with HDIG domain
VNLWAIIPLISLITFTILLIFILPQAKRRVTRIFAIFLFASGAWSFFAFMLDYNLTASSSYLIFWNRFVIPAIPWVAVCYYHFIRAYNNKQAGIGVYLGYAFVLIILAFSLAGYVVKDAYMVNGFLYHEIKPWDYVIAAVLFPVTAATIIMLVQRYRHSSDPSDRNRTTYLIVGWSFLLLVSYITPFHPSLSGLPTDHIGNLFNAIIISYAISRLSLLDIKFIARRLIAFIVIIITLGGIYTGLILLQQRLSPNLPYYSFAGIFTLILLVLVMMTRPPRYIVQELVDRFFYRKTYHYRQELLNFSSKIVSIIDLESLANEMLPTINKALGIKQAILLFEETDSGDFISQYSYPKEIQEKNNGPKFSVDNPIIDWFIEESSPLILTEIDGKPQFKGLWQEEREVLLNSDIELLCPIKRRGKLIGILALGKKQSNSLYSHEDIGLITSLADQASIIIDNAQLLSKAIAKGNTDELTKLANFRYFQERLDQEIARSIRFNTTFSLTILDIDLLKTYNDKFGHLAGDKVLRKIGECLRISTRSIDIPARYGGDEFAIILPGTSLNAAYTVAERTRKFIESECNIQSIPVTASFGVACWPIDGPTKEELIAKADAALYQAKQTGRNKTCLSSDLVQTKTPSPREKSETSVTSPSLNHALALAANIDAKDYHTAGHSQKVSQYAVAIAVAMNLPKEKIAYIRAAGLLHDIGKIALPDYLLRKEGPLTDDEWILIKAHTKIGMEIVGQISELADCLPAILHHHEHYNGKGYPNGLKSENIPLEARILAIADAYDAMTSTRPYRKQLSPQQALDELKSYAGTQFDPSLVDIFCKIIEPTL